MARSQNSGTTATKRKTAAQRFEKLRLEVLKIQVLCMQESEPELAEACSEMGTTARDAILMRVSDTESPTDFETRSTGGPPG